jgi:hypothetical protein
MIHTIITSEGKELYATVETPVLNDGEIAIEELRTEHFENPYFDFETRTFYNKID